MIHVGCQCDQMCSKYTSLQLKYQNIYTFTRKKWARVFFCPFKWHILKYKLTDRNLLDRIMCMSWQCYQPHLVVPWKKSYISPCVYMQVKKANIKGPKSIYCMGQILISKIWCYRDIPNVQYVQYSFVLDGQQSDTEKGWGVWGPRGFKNFKFIFYIG